MDVGLRVSGTFGGLQGVGLKVDSIRLSGYKGLGLVALRVEEGLGFRDWGLGFRPGCRL